MARIWVWNYIRQFYGSRPVTTNFWLRRAWAFVVWNNPQLINYFLLCPLLLVLPLALFIIHLSDKTLNFASLYSGLLQELPLAISQNPNALKLLKPWLGSGFRYTKQPTIDKLFLAMFFTTGPAFDTLYHRSIWQNPEFRFAVFRAFTGIALGNITQSDCSEIVIGTGLSFCETTHN